LGYWNDSWIIRKDFEDEVLWQFQSISTLPRQVLLVPQETRVQRKRRCFFGAPFFFRGAQPGLFGLAISVGFV